MHGDPLALMEQLDGGAGEAGIDRLAQEPVGRRVVVVVDLDVIVGRHRAALPFGIGYRSAGSAFSTG